MRDQAPRSVTLWSVEPLAVWARLLPDGRLVIEGQDLAPPFPGVREYEYAWTVAAADVPRVVAALGGEASDDPLDVLERHGAEVVRAGESRWLKAQGVDAEFWNRYGA